MTEPTRPLPELIDITTVAKILGVDARHVRRLVYERRIPIIKWGHLVRFDPDEIADWIDNRRRPVGTEPGAGQSETSIRSLPRRRPAQAALQDSTGSSGQGQLLGRWPPDRKEAP
jgi:excisionase family DNA binding protein